MRVPVQSGPSFQAGMPEDLIGGLLGGLNPKTYGVAPDGERTLSMFTWNSSSRKTNLRYHDGVRGDPRSSALSSSPRWASAGPNDAELTSHGSEVTMKRIGVFCGSSAGARPDYARAAVELGKVLVSRNLALVYGGGRIGLMGRIAEAVVAAGGEVVGVIPKFLVDKELAFQGATELRTVSTMSERKAVIAELSDAFVALPGGYGTLDELVEMLTWGQLGLHDKPCGLLNTCGYYNDLVSWIGKSVEEHFLQEEHRSMLVVEEDAGVLVDRLQAYRHPKIDKTKWILGLETQDPKG